MPYTEGCLQEVDDELEPKNIEENEAANIYLMVEVSLEDKDTKVSYYELPMSNEDLLNDYFEFLDDKLNFSLQNI